MNDIVIIEKLEELGVLQWHHDAWARGYLSRRRPGKAARYHGRFGHGYTVDFPSRSSTVYHIRSYYIWSDPAMEEKRVQIEERCDLLMGENSE